MPPSFGDIVRGSRYDEFVQLISTDLPAGIHLALKRKQPVAIFIRDDSSKSTLWQDDYIQDDEILDMLLDKAVNMRFQAGSAEAGQLSAFCPIDSVPAFLVIYNGEILAHLKGDISKEAFISQLNEALRDAPSAPSHSSSTTPAAISASPAPDTLDATRRASPIQAGQADMRAEDSSNVSNAPHDPISPTVPTIPTSQAAPNTPTIASSALNTSINPIIPDPPVVSMTSDPLSDPPPAPELSPETTAATSQPRTNIPSPSDPATVQSFLAERGVRLEAEKKKREAAEKADRIVKAKAKRAETEAQAKAGSSSSSSKAPNRKYAEEQRKLKSEARQERERILRLVENDKAERKEREERRRAKARLEKEQQEGEQTSTTPTTTSALHQTTPPASASSKTCAIQVRLFDGSTLRSRFPSTDTINATIRPWIDSHLASSSPPNTNTPPYTLKQILAPPHPTRAISLSEESDSLASLGLTPSATLIMSPIQGATDAYANARGGISGLVSRGVYGGYGLVSASVGYVAGGLGTFLGLGGGGGGQATPSGPAAAAHQRDPSSSADADEARRRREDGRAAPSSSGVRVRMLHDQHSEDDARRDEPREFYNGNQLNFEPSRKSDDERHGDKDD